MKGYFGLAVAVLCVLVPMIYAGCMERGCCLGKDNKCWTKGPRMNPASNKTECFCDETCHVLGDCCTDYTQACVGESNACFSRNLITNIEKFHTIHLSLEHKAELSISIFDDF